MAADGPGAQKRCADRRSLPPPCTTGAAIRSRKYSTPVQAQR